MYEEKQYPTLDKLLALVHHKGVFPGGRTTLFLLLKELGFRYHKRDDSTNVATSLSKDK